MLTLRCDAFAPRLDAPVLINRVFGRIGFVNADVIASGLSGLDPERRAFAAGRIMLRQIKALAHQQRDFAFESTLASRTFAQLIRNMIGDGYDMHLIYVWLRSPDIAVDRVRARVESGGHDVPEHTIRRRFVRSIRNLFDLYIPLAASWEIFENASLLDPSLIATGSAHGDMMIHDETAWKELERYRNDS